MPTNDDETTPGSKYGYTAALTDKGDLKINDLNRLANVYDHGAVVQDAKVALLTPKGFDPFRPDFGINVFRAIGTSDEQLRGAIIDCIRSMNDDRIDRVADVDISRPDGDREDTHVVITLELTDNQRVQFPYRPESELV